MEKNPKSLALEPLCTGKICNKRKAVVVYRSGAVFGAGNKGIGWMFFAAKRKIVQSVHEGPRYGRERVQALRRCKDKILILWNLPKQGSEAQHLKTRIKDSLPLGQYESTNHATGIRRYEVQEIVFDFTCPDPVNIARVRYKDLNGPEAGTIRSLPMIEFLEPCVCGGHTSPRFWCVEEKPELKAVSVTTDQALM